MVVTARRAEAVQDFVEEFGDRAVAVALDVTDAGQIAAAVAAAQQAFGGIDVLVNNAGHGYLSAVEEGEDAEVRKLFDVNYFGSVDMIKAVLPSMRARGSGHIVNISSMTGLVANPPNAYYSSTKFALEAVTEALATEVRPLGIKVTAIEPGAFRTDWATRSMKESATPIADYADVAARKDLIKQFADHLPGDPRKVAEQQRKQRELEVATVAVRRIIRNRDDAPDVIVRGRGPMNVVDNDPEEAPASPMPRFNLFGQ